MRLIAFITCLLAVVPASAQPNQKLSDAEKKDRQTALSAAFPKLEADYLALVKKARAELDDAKSRFERDKDASAYQAAIHRYHWAITGNTALGDIAKTITQLRELHAEYDDRGQFKRPRNEAYSREALAGFHWIERHVWGNMIEPVAPVGVVDRAYLKKKPIKLLMAGDSITDYMDPGVTMLDHLDSRFQVLGQGLAGHSIHSWFTSNSTPAALDWHPDIIVIMLGTNGTTAAMADDASKKNTRDIALAKYRDDLLSLRKLPSKPQVILVSVPAQGPGLWHHGVPAMWEMQSHIAREQGFPFIDMSKGLAGMLSDIPNGFTYCPNRKTVGKWSHSFDDAHCSQGPAMARYYGLVCRQILEPTAWYNLNLTCSATTDATWKEPWLIAQCFRDPGESADRAQGMQKQKGDSGYKIIPHQAKIKRGKANGEVSFLRPKTGGDFYMMPGRTHTLTFGRPYQVYSNDPPRAGFPTRYDISGTITRGDGQAPKDVKITLGKQTTTTDANGRFTLTRLEANPTECTIVIGAVP